MIRYLMAIALLAGTSAVPAFDPSDLADDSDGKNWLAYGRTYGEQRYSPLKQINDENIERLGLAWSVELPGETHLVSTPLVIDGVIYFAGSYSKVWAIDARTQTVLWSHDPETIEHAGAKLRVLWGTSRGLAYWNDKIYAATGDGRLIALDAATGKVLWSQMTVESDSAFYITGAPRAFKGKVIIGNGGAEMGPVRGYVTAYDAETGEQVWRWWTVPGNPADGFENNAMKYAATTWKGEWWKHGGGGTVWNAMTYDPEFNHIYLGTGNGAPWNQRIRSPGGGDNLFLCAIVALDADTGKYKWHYQTVPGETWDFNSAMDIVLADITVHDRDLKVLMHAPKNGFFYIINRSNGKLLSARPFAKITWAKEIDMKSGRPIETEGARYPSGEVTIWPGPLGAHNWQPMSYNPGTGLVYLPYHDLAGYYNDSKIIPAEWRHTALQFDVGVAGYQDDFPVEGATSGLMGWDPITQSPKWTSVNPGMWNAGTMTTAGNLVFQGHADGKLKAYRADNGDIIWDFDAKHGISASPVTFEVDGTQHVAMLVGWGGGVAALGGSMGAQHGWMYGVHPRRLLVFALGGKAQLPPTPPPRMAKVLPAPKFEIDQELASAGGLVWEKNCTWCHGPGVVAAGGAPDLRASAIPLDLATLKAIVLDGKLRARGMPWFPHLNGDDVEAVQHFIRKKARASMAELAVTRRD
ncbi:MAG: PQQ-dependent dehydrogenase, methanol/ethanol family [Proteobacteria bacterium]|nr:PQQ-dependent dehydrogenase, methanol/ethanol family [Pseudomonadota bacterium]